MVYYCFTDLIYICICIRIYIYVCIYIYCKYEYVSKPWYPRYHKIAGLWMVYPLEHGKKGFDPSPYKGRTCIITLVCRGTQLLVINTCMFIHTYIYSDGHSLRTSFGKRFFIFMSISMFGTAVNPHSQNQENRSFRTSHDDLLT